MQKVAQSEVCLAIGGSFAKAIWAAELECTLEVKKLELQALLGLDSAHSTLCAEASR